MMTGALAYARLRMKALDRVEWADAFNEENIPKPMLAKCFHLELGTVQGVSNNQDSQVSLVPITVTIPFAPARATKTVRDDAAAYAETVIADFINPRNRLTQAGIKDARFDTLALEALDKSNDNGLKIKLVFSVMTISSTR